MSTRPSRMSPAASAGSRVRSRHFPHLIAGRLGTPEESRSATVFLLSDETPYLNGYDLDIDRAVTVAT